MTAGEASDDLTEFSFLEADADRLGVSVRDVERVDLGAGLSGLRWLTGPPLLALAHGAGLHAHSWDSVALSLGAPSLSIDLPGHGQSAWRDDARYSPLEIAPTLTDALREWPTVSTLVGHSLGGLALIPAAAALSDAVTRLVLVDVTPGFAKRERNTDAINAFISGPESYASRDEVIDRALAHGIGRRREDLIRGIFLNTRVRPDGRVEFRHHLSRLDASAHRGYDPETLWAPLDDAPKKVLLIRATAGVLDDEHVAEFREHRPDATVVELRGSHNLYRDDPRGVAEAIARFIG
ncbi:pimeloyl-ACP methyl ester carboxylesterase [Compostimonas suwonensis]|uniref:Pimeloyl-ACP methyl ester carboxylesterase n=2 Tax=Compostimonas suwonensis TaxID=1048394 RepID=A0A2M9BUB0_9MICO|nr:pimeloyl-ACP methyl ester carboxylesterase [Compostimonas suwonensis]